MIKRPVLLAVVMILSLSMAACQKAKEPEAKKGGVQKAEVKQPPVGEGQPQPLEQGQSAQPEAMTAVVLGQGQPETVNSSSKEIVPLITEVMTKEELQVYLKEKGIPIIKKEDFKEPELVWEKTFNVPVESISDLTDSGSSIVLSTDRFNANKTNKKALLFLDNKGNIRKRVEVEDITSTPETKPYLGDYAVFNYLYLAMSGKNAGIYKADGLNKKSFFSYYDETGNLLWAKVVSTNESPSGYAEISYDGSVVAVTQGNPYFSAGEEGGAPDINVEKITFYDSKGNLLSVYSGFRNLSIAKLSDDGQFCTAIIWISNGVQASYNRLIYIRTKDGKVIWERPFPGYTDQDIPGESYDLAISEKGSYVAAINMGKERNRRAADAEVQVFDKEGKMVARIKGGAIYSSHEQGFIDVGRLVDILKHKFLGRLFLHNDASAQLWENPVYSIVKLKERHGTVFVSKDMQYLKMDAGVKITIFRSRVGGRNE